MTTTDALTTAVTDEMIKQEALIATALGDHFRRVVEGSSGMLFAETKVHFPADQFAGYAKAVAAALASQPAPAPAGEAWRPTHRHVKRRSEYEVVGEAEAQISDGQSDRFGDWRVLYEGNRLIVYRARDGKLWCRFPDEFNDGRFEPLPSPPRSPRRQRPRLGLKLTRGGRRRERHRHWHPGAQLRQTQETTMRTPSSTLGSTGTSSANACR